MTTWRETGQPGIAIRAIASALPARRVTNEELARAHPDWDMQRLEQRTGVLERPIAAPDETAFDFGVAASRTLLERYPELGRSVDAVIFCTQTPDYVMPPNACLLHGALDLPDDILAFDITLACSGYVYGLSLARSLIASNQAHGVLLVTGDTYSRLIHPGDRATRCLFGDGAAATIVTSAGPHGGGILGVRLGTVGKLHNRFMVPAGGMRTPRCEATQQEVRDRHGNVRTLENITMDGLGVLGFSNDHVARAVRDTLRDLNLTQDDIDLFVFHQASRVALESLSRVLGIPAEKSFSNLDRVGNLVSASLPIAFKQALEEGHAKPGDRVLLCGFGVGLSWGVAVIDIGPTDTADAP